MIIDALDTMHIIGLTWKYEHARLWIADSLSLDRSGLVNAFEITTRVLGGLLSACHLSLDPPVFGQGRRPRRSSHANL